VLSEAYVLIHPDRGLGLSALLRRQALAASFSFSSNSVEVMELMRRYAAVPMSFADACLVRMTDIETDPALLTTDSDFAIYPPARSQDDPAGPA
jgi:uncharacterized protein